jgi:hypothetical protein
VFVAPPASKVPRPVRELCGFAHRARAWGDAPAACAARCALVRLLRSRSIARPLEVGVASSCGLVCCFRRRSGGWVSEGVTDESQGVGSVQQAVHGRARQQGVAEEPVQLVRVAVAGDDGGASFVPEPDDP